MPKLMSSREALPGPRRIFPDSDNSPISSSYDLSFTAVQVLVYDRGSAILSDGLDIDILRFSYAKLLKQSDWTNEAS